MKKERYEFLKQHIHELDIDIKNGIILNRKQGKPKTDTGYLRTYVNKRQYYVHEIIVVAAGYDLTNMVVDHVDRNKLNNRIENLEVVTQAENARRISVINAKLGKLGAPKKTENDERNKQIRSEYATGSISLRALGKKYGLHHSSIVHIVKNG